MGGKRPFGKPQILLNNRVSPTRACLTPQVWMANYGEYTMQLWEDQKVVHALKHILKDYDYLEYDEAASKRINALKVKVTRLDADRDISAAGDICSALQKETGRRFFVPSVVTQGSQSWITEWTYFNVRERPFHKNVKITYPPDRSKPVVVECYVGEYMNLFAGDPQITQYADANGEIKIKFQVIDRATGKTVLSELKNVALDFLAKTAAEVMTKSGQ